MGAEEKLLSGKPRAIASADWHASRSLGRLLRCGNGRGRLPPDIPNEQPEALLGNVRKFLA
jgi:hypothetical protein